MTARGPYRLVSRIRVLFGAACLAALLAVVVTTTELLRYPPADPPVPQVSQETDVRDELLCDKRSPGDEPGRVSSTDLHDCPTLYDGRTVVYDGEVVGAVLPRRGGAWVQLNDDAYGGHLAPLPAHQSFRGGNTGVGVFLTAQLADVVHVVGGPRARGDRLRVTGTFHRVDPASGEVAVIVADAAVVASPGVPSRQAPLRGRRFVGVLLTLAAIGLTVATRRSSSR